MDHLDQRNKDLRDENKWTNGCETEGKKKQVGHEKKKKKLKKKGPSLKYQCNTVNMDTTRQYLHITPERLFQVCFEHQSSSGWWVGVMSDKTW